MKNHNDFLHHTFSQHTNQQDTNEHDTEVISTVHYISTRVQYLSLPEPQLQLVKPTELLHAKEQIEQDHSSQFQCMSNIELNDIFRDISNDDTIRYINSYNQLYQRVLESKLKCIDISEETLQLQHSTDYYNELLSVLAQNHKLARREQRILYDVAAKAWNRFDECMRNETDRQRQLEQVKHERQQIRTIKIQQEQYQLFIFKIDEIKQDITNLTTEIQEFSSHKRQLQEAAHEIKARCSRVVTELDFLKSNMIRPRTSELNNLQLERDSIVTQNTLIKHDLLEQIHRHEKIMKEYRANLCSLQTTIYGLEEELEQQTDIETTDLLEYQTVNHDINKFIFTLENNIKERNLANALLKKAIGTLQEKIQKQRQALMEKEIDFKKMEHLNQEFIQSIHIHREKKLQFKTERHIIERQLKSKSKQYTNDERIYRALTQQHNILLARKRVAHAQLNASKEHIYQLAEETTQLNSHIEHRQRQFTQTNSDTLLNLRNKVLRLKHIHQASIQETLVYERTKMNYQKTNEKLYFNTNRIVHRIDSILKRVEDYSISYKSHSEKILTLENALGEGRNYCLQTQCFILETKDQLESYHAKQRFLQTQVKAASDSIRHSQYRLKTFDQELSACHNDVHGYQVSLTKLREFYTVLRQQDDLYMKKLSNGREKLARYHQQYDLSQRNLQQTEQDLVKYLSSRSILGHMTIRRVNLCQLLYRKLSRVDENVYQREKSIEVISKCITAIVTQIRELRNLHRRSIERKGKTQLETVQAHTTKILDRPHEKQRILTQKMFQRCFYASYSPNVLITENMVYLQHKSYVLKNRLIKVVCRGIICNYVLMSIQQELVKNLEDYTLNANRMICIDLNETRTKLYQMIRRLKAKTAENNMLVDYRYYIKLIHADTIQQIFQWKAFDSIDDA